MRGRPFYHAARGGARAPRYPAPRDPEGGPARRRRTVTHVVLAPHRFLPARGGVQTVFACAARALARRGTRATVVTSNGTSTGSLGWPGSPLLPGGAARVADVDVVRLAIRHPSAVARTLRHWRRRLASGAEEWRQRSLQMGPDLPGLDRTIAELAPDVVVAAGVPFRHVFDLREIARRRRVPFALMPCLHADEPGAFATAFGRDLAKGADFVLALTPFEADAVAAWGVDRARVSVLPLGPDFPAESAPDASPLVPPGAPYFLCLGRLTPQKNVPLVLAAFERVAAATSGVRLVVAGGSTDWSEANLRASERIVVAPDFDDAFKRPLLAGAAALVNPSHEESFGIVFAEAWAVARPVVGIRAGAVATIVEDGVTGLLAERGSAASLAEAMARILRDPAAAEAMGRRGAARIASSRGWDGAAETIEGLARR
jgi:glycosyltransferase involved in cell wall biosynthesis